MPKVTEKVVRKRITQILNLYKEYNSVYVQFPITQGFGESGHPDVLILINGKLLGVEAKKDTANHHCRPNRKPTKSEAAQVLQAKRIKAAGGAWHCIHADNLTELIQALDSVALHISSDFSITHIEQLDKLTKVNGG